VVPPILTDDERNTDVWLPVQRVLAKIIDEEAKYPI
jgi:hypothetical protein